MRTLITRSAIVAAFAFAGVVQAQTPWSGVGGSAGPSGSASFFDWANGHNSNSNLFGSPTLIGDTFYFFPSNFVAQSNNGATVAATDTIDVDLIIHANLKFDGVSVTEYGDFSIDNSTTTGGSVNCTGVMSITDLANVRSTLDNMAFSQTFPATSGVNQAFSGGTSRDLAAIEFGVPFTTIHLSITNDLLAISSPNGSAVIRKTLVGGTMAVAILPEPGVLGLLAAAGLMAARRRR